jgi:hypothetical protein
MVIRVSDILSDMSAEKDLRLVDINQLPRSLLVGSDDVFKMSDFLLVCPAE